MHARNPFDPKIVIAHITKQQGPQRPREHVKLFQSTFITDTSESQSRRRESKREAILQLTDRREAYRKHKKTFPPLDSLARPEHILQLASLPGARKILILGKMIKLWQTINAPTSTQRDYERAVRKLSDVSGLVHGAVKQGDTARVARQDCRENLDLSVGLKACGICLAPFGDGGNEGEMTKIPLLTPVSELPILLPCCHLACYGCMTFWPRQHSFCPCCDMMFENVEKLKITMESQVRHYDYELAEALDLL